MKYMLKTCLVVLFLFLTSFQEGEKYPLSIVGPTDPLFQSEDILRLHLKTDIRTLLRDRGDVREYHSATLGWQEENGDSASLGLKVRVRGNFRRKASTCAFPPIRLNFKKGEVKGTLFEGQDKLKLVTHCQNRQSTFEQFVLIEYLIYRMYNLFTEKSFKVRLVEMTYEDEKGKKDPMKKWGFLIEDVDRMASRNDAVALTGAANYHPDAINREMEVLMAVFEFLIGNTDWSIPYQHNVKIIQQEQNLPIAVPYDFDWSGLISAPYAQPNGTLGIESVRQRLYRGFCRSKDEYDSVFDRFNEKRAEIEGLFQNCSQMNPKTRKRCLKYIDGFYQVINNEKKVRYEILEKCRK